MYGLLPVPLQLFTESIETAFKDPWPNFRMNNSDKIDILGWIVLVEWRVVCIEALTGRTSKSQHP